MDFAFTFDISRGVLSSAGSAVALEGLTLRRGSVNTFTVYLWKSGAPYALPVGYTLEACAKASPDADSLLLFGEWSGTQPIVASVNASSAALSLLLGADSDGTNDADAEAFLDFVLLNGSGQIVSQSQRVPLAIENTITHGGETGPELAPVSARLIENLYTVTGLTGGGSTKLDGRATLTLPQNWRVMLTSGGVNFFYELKLGDGSEVESLPELVLPDDYDATTNAKYWQHILIGTDAPAGWGAVYGDIDDQSDINALFARLASPALTGTPTAPTAAPGTNTLQLATCAFVIAVRDDVLNAAPSQLDTLQEIAAALGNDANYAASTTAAIAARALATRALSAAGLVTGGGDLSADRTFTVTAATQTQAEAGSSNVVALTPQSGFQMLAKLGMLNPGAITAYTGGGAGKLDGIVTASRLALGHCVDTAISGKSRRWQLQTWDGVEIEDASAGRVLPDDADASTNPVIWVTI